MLLWYKSHTPIVYIQSVVNIRATILNQLYSIEYWQNLLDVNIDWPVELPGI